MQISLRSQMVAGAAAIIGTSALAITPIAQPALELSTLRAPAVVLTAFDNPVAAFVGSMDWVVNDLFNGFDTYAPFDMYQGIFPEQVYMAQPVQSQMSMNRFDYIDTLVYGLLSGPNSSFVSISNMVWDLPSALITATEQFFTGDPAAALATLNAAIVAPIEQAFASGVDAVAYVVTRIVENVVNVIADVPNLAGGLFTTSIGAAQTLIDTAVGVAANIITAASSLDIEGAWNAGVEGLLSTSGFPGALETLTLGPGFGTWGESDYQSSFRVWAEGAIFSIANDLGGDYPTPPTAESAAAASVKAAGAVAPLASSTLVAATGTDAASAGSDKDIASSIASADAAAKADSSATDSVASNAGGSTAGDNDTKSDSAKSDSDTNAGAAKRAGNGHAKSHGSLKSSAKADSAA